MNKFYYDSRQHGARKMTAANVPCVWVQVLQHQDEYKVIDSGPHTAKGKMETFGQLAFSAQRLVTWSEPFVVEVEPEVGMPFRILGCRVGARYDGYGEDVVIFDFVAEKLDFMVETKYAGASHVDRPRCRLCGGEANANGQSVHQIHNIACGPVAGARRGEVPLANVKIGPEYKDVSEQSIEELKRLVEKLNDRPVTPEQERVCREFGEAWVRGIVNAIRPGLVTARPMCEFCEASLGEKHHAHYLCPQSDDGGKTVEWRLCCYAHRDGWWEGADWRGLVYRLEEDR